MQRADIGATPIHLAPVRIATRTRWLATPAAIVLLATLLGAALRLHSLGEWSFWSDEISTLARIDDGFNTGLLRHPLSELLVGLLSSALGPSEWSARLGPALIGIASIPALYLPLRRALGPAVAAVTLLLLAVSPWHLYWSQNARFYVLLLLLFSLALLSFYVGVEEDRPGYLVLALLLIGLAARERLLAAFFLPIVVAYLAAIPILRLEPPRGLRPRNLALFFVPALLAGAVFAWPYLSNLGGWLAGFGRVNNSPTWLLAGFGYYVGVPTIGLGIAGAVYLLHQRRRIVLLLALTGAVPITVLMAIAPFHYTANRYAFISLIAWLALASVAAVELFNAVPRHGRTLAAIALLVLLLDPLAEDVLYFRYQNGNREDWRAAFAYVEERRQEADGLVVSDPMLARYYQNGTVTAMAGADPSKLGVGTRRTWFVVDMTVRERWPALDAWIHEHARQVADFDVYAQARTFEMGVYLYDPQWPPAAGSPAAATRPRR